MEEALDISDLAEKLAAEHDLPKAQAQRVVEAAFAAVADAVATGQEVTIPGFGNLRASDRAARQGRKPRNWRDHTDRGLAKGSVHRRQFSQGPSERRGTPRRYRTCCAHPEPSVSF